MAVGRVFGGAGFGWFVERVFDSGDCFVGWGHDDHYCFPGVGDLARIVNRGWRRFNATTTASRG